MDKKSGQKPTDAESSIFLSNNNVDYQAAVNPFLFYKKGENFGGKKLSPPPRFPKMDI